MAERFLYGTDYRIPVSMSIVSCTAPFAGTTTCLGSALRQPISMHGTRVMAYLPAGTVRLNVPVGESCAYATGVFGVSGVMTTERPIYGFEREYGHGSTGHKGPMETVPEIVPVAGATGQALNAQLGGTRPTYEPSAHCITSCVQYTGGCGLGFGVGVGAGRCHGGYQRCW